MPHIEFPQPVKKFSEETKTVSSLHWQEIADKLNVQLHGWGVSCKVISTPEIDRKVFAINYVGLSPSQAKNIFYTQRVLSTLFPYNFPKIYAAGEPGTVRQKVEGISGGDEGYIPGRSIPTLDGHISEGIATIMAKLTQSVKVSTHPSQKINYPFLKVQLALRDLGMLKSIDAKQDNFILGEGGEEYYVDTGITKPVKEWNIKAIEKYIKKQGLSEDEKRSVMIAIQRLKESEKTS